MSTTSLAPKDAFAHELAMYGPATTMARPLSIHQSRDYCRRLARRHYENFTVASWLLPRRLRPHFYHVYAYCRWADDLADETSDAQRSLELLDWWESQLLECYQGRATHPVFVALGETIAQFDIPRQPFLDLLSAFRQDQSVTRYETFDELEDYCRRSANPVGRLVLYLIGAQGPEQLPLADSICTGLQLANFWQDVSRDWERGRIYLPAQTRRRFGCDESTFERRQHSPAFRKALEFEVARAERYLQTGLGLVPLVPRRLHVDIALFAHGGLAILEKIKQVEYDVWNHRPALSKWDGLRLFLRCWWQIRRRGVKTS